jgi:predicted nucleotidyltransferase
MTSEHPVYSGLRAALRTERNVRLAVVYGSVARGDDMADSDVDVLVALAKDAPDAGVRLAVRLERKLGRQVDVARLERVAQRAPLFLLQVLEEGRVVVDRDGQWPALLDRRATVARRAKRARTALRKRAAAAVRALAED